MTSNDAVAAVRAALLAVLVLLCGCSDAPPTARPNVLLICIDALRADRLGIYGASPSPSPALDELARASVVFENATSVASWTKPSVPSLLTGLYPDEHGVFDNSGDHADTLGAGAVPLASILAEHGYRTAAFVENDQLEIGVSGLDRGFSLYFDKAGRPPEIADRFLSWAEADRGAPWFAYLHFLDPHFPYSPDDFSLESGEAARLRVRERHWDLGGELWWMLRQRVNEGSMRLDRDAVADLDRLYQLEIRAVDAVVGRMLRLLDADGVLDRTMVIVTADHGEGFLERGRVDHGYGPYQELLHVPLLIRLPDGEHAGTRTAALVQNVDIAATVLARAGLPLPAAWSSVSLLPALGPQAKEVRTVALASERHGHWRLLAARDQRFSYVRSENAVAERRPPASLPESAVPGIRVRARGIFDGTHFVAGSVRRLGPGDTDTELLGPVESVDAGSRNLRIFGITVSIGEGVREARSDGRHATRTIADFLPGELVRLHGSRRGEVFVPTKIERPAPDSIEMEGIVRRIQVQPDGDVMVDLGDVSMLIDPRAHWNDFPGTVAKAPPGSEQRVVERTTEQLFDRQSDPHELRDIAAENPGELDRMRALADKTLGALMAAAPQDSRSTPLDDETRQRLRALGYVE